MGGRGFDLPHVLVPNSLLNKKISIIFGCIEECLQVAHLEKRPPLPALPTSLAMNALISIIDILLI